MLKGIGFLIIGLAFGLGMGLSKTPGTAKTVLAAIAGSILALRAAKWIELDRPLALLGLGLIIGMVAGILLRIYSAEILNMPADEGLEV